MRDYFDREVKENDLVVTKATGRNSRIRHGIALENGRVWFGPNSIGGASVYVLIPTEHDPKLEEKRLELIEKRDKHLFSVKENKKKVNETRIKKFERFGAYFADSSGVEIYLDDAIINGVEQKNVWLSMEKKEYRGGYGLDNLQVSVVDYGYGPFSHSRSTNVRYYQASYMIRTVKKPTKTKLVHQFTKDEVQAFLDAEWEKCKTGDYKSQECIGWIKIT